MDEPHLLAAIRYVLLNPVRAGLARSATDWPHSSARAHVFGEPDPLVDCGPVSERITDWTSCLGASAYSSQETEVLRRHGTIGRPLGCDSFIEKLERIVGRRLRPHKVGRKPKRESSVK